MFSEWIRRTTYWTFDFLSGSKVKKHYVDIKNIMENNTSSIIFQKKKKYITDILEYASKHVEFYKPYYAYSTLNDFPIINKSIIKEHYDQFQSPEYSDANVINMHTSGSTGTPFVVRQDMNKRNRVLAEMIYFWGKAGFQVGIRYVFFRIWTSGNRKSKFSTISRNLVMSDILSLDENNLEIIRKMLKRDHKIKMLLGYASTFENLANYLLSCKDKPDMFSLKTVISGSEVLSETVRQKLNTVFNCNVVSLYSNQENGVLAQECIDNKEFHVNSASYVMEILKIDNDEPAPVGELGRVVITDLFNRAMPIIRYDTGDLARKKNRAECGWNTSVISQVEGRKVDMIYATDGTPLSPHTWSVYMWKYNELKQYQFIQEDEKKYTIKVNGAEGVYPDEDIELTMKEILGADAEITIEHVSQIPVLESGKFKKTICNYKPKMR